MVRVNDPEGCMSCATRPSCVVGRLSVPVVAAIEPVITRRRLARGESIAKEGEVAHSASLVKIGTAFGLRRGLDGGMRPVGIAGRGAAFGMMGYFNQPSQLSAVAASPVRICDIPHATLHKAASGDSDLHAHFTSTAASAIGLIADWSVGIRVRGVPNQLACALLLMARTQRTPVLELPTHASLAELLCATRETVARAFSTLRSEGCVRLLGRGKCEVDADALLRRLRQP